MTYELFIQHGSTLMFPPIVDGVTIEWQRKGQPGKLTFECIKTDGLDFAEGDACRFSVDGTPMFYGFVFEKSRSGLHHGKSGLHPKHQRRADQKPHGKQFFIHKSSNCFHTHIVIFFL